MGLVWTCLLSLVLVFGQGPEPPPYVAQGQRVEASFREFRDELEGFFFALRSGIEKTFPELLDAMDEPPPEPIEYGYQLLPPILSLGPVDRAGEEGPAARSYSWPITQDYVDNELVRLRRAETRLETPASSGDRQVLADLVEKYRLLVGNQKIIDQHVQYNRFWQRTVAEDRSRFDRLTELYMNVMAGDPDVARTVQEVLGQPTIPPFLRVDGTADAVILRLPVYTDIGDVAYLGQVEQAIEETWRTDDGKVSYALDIEFRTVSVDDLYPDGDAPKRGDHLDLEAHAARFPMDGALLTTGAESTHAFPGRSVLLGAGELSTRTLAHEFGHLLGFRDGYLRGYRDLGREGFEILELTSTFDDIMSAPGQGGVGEAHFRLLVDAVGSRGVD